GHPAALRAALFRADPPPVAPGRRRLLCRLRDRPVDDLDPGGAAVRFRELFRRRPGGRARQRRLRRLQAVVGNRGLGGRLHLPALLRRAARAADAARAGRRRAGLAARGARRVLRLAGAAAAPPSRAVARRPSGAAGGRARLHAGVPQPEVPTGGDGVAAAGDGRALGRAAATGRPGRRLHRAGRVAQGRPHLPVSALGPTRTAAKVGVARAAGRVIGVTIWLAGRAASHDGWTIRLGVAALMTSLLIVSSVTWQHHLVTLLLPMATALAWISARRPGARYGWALMAAYGACWIDRRAFPLPADLQVHSASQGALVLAGTSVKLLGLLLLWGLLLEMLRRERKLMGALRRPV